MTVRYLDDLVVGEVAEFGDRLMTAEEIIRFAREFDPQPFHIDAEAAGASVFGGLIASGWHSAAVAMRMCVDAFLSPESSMGSPGVDELRWHLPVRPGDRLRLRVTTLEILPSRSKPDRGIARHRMELLNQHGQAVMSFIAMALLRRRPDIAKAPHGPA